MISPPESPSDASCEILTISAEDFTEHATFAESLKSVIRAAEGYQLLTVTDVPLGWEDFLWEVEEDLPATRKSYDPITRILRVSIMPTYAHDVASGWLTLAIWRWCQAGLTTAQDPLLLWTASNATIEFKTGPCRGWKKEPDAVFRVKGQVLPTLAIEVGWWENYRDLLDDMNRLLVGGNGDIQVVIIIKWNKQGNNVYGFLELYRLNQQGISCLEQRETIFPAPEGQGAPQQQLCVTRSELFGRSFVPGTTGANILPLDVDWLRQIACEQFGAMGLVPA